MLTAARVLAASILLQGVALSVSTLAATSGANGTHDPSRMVESDGAFWVFSTGGGSKSSPDGLVWTSGGRLFPNGYPAWVKTVVPNDQGVWAPDVIFHNGQYFLFYSVASASSMCATGVMTSPTLDQKSPKYAWTDRGKIVSNGTSETYCTIDPAPVVDADKNLWVVWGSGYSHPSDAKAIWITRLDNTTGLPSADDKTKPGYALSNGHEEGAYVHYHAPYYYLFYNTGGCCNGADSNYLIHVARSNKISGGYTGTRNFYGTKGSIHGPGHIGIFNDCGVERFTYHYYPDSGNSVLGENELTWGADGWPVVGPESTTPIKPCNSSPGAGVGGSSGSAGAGMGGGSTGHAGAGAGGAPSSSAGSAALPGTGTGSAGELAGQAGTSVTPAGGAGGGGSVIPGGSSSTPPTTSTDTAGGCTFALPGVLNEHGALALFAAAAALTARKRRRTLSSRPVEPNSP